MGHLATLVKGMGCGEQIICLTLFICLAVAVRPANILHVQGVVTRPKILNRTILAN